MKIGTLTTGSVTTEFTLPYLPSVLHIPKPANDLAAIRINSLGDGTLTDIDTKGILAIGLNNKIGAKAADIVIPICQGLIGNRNTTISITNNGAQTPDVFVYSFQKSANFYIKNTTQKVFANSGIEITDFSMACFPNMGANDELNVTYRDGLVQKLTREDLRSIVSLGQDVNADANDYILSNVGQTISRVSFIPTADQSIYLQKYARRGNQ